MEDCTSNTSDTNLLSQRDRHTLEVGSRIARDKIERRGVYTVEYGRDLPKGYSRRQRRRGGGTLFKIHRPNGKTSWSFRPRDLDPENPGHKYEQPCKAYGGPGNVLDVHPDDHHLIADTSVQVYFVEGVKKADALATALRAAGIQAVVIAISGVWNWMSDGEPIPDMLDVPMEGRSVTITFDSDMLTNPQVQDAAGQLAEYVGARGAEVWITYFKDAVDGSKVGADDFFVAGGTVAELRLLTRRWDPADFARIHMDRDAKLRDAVERLRDEWEDFNWPGVVGTGKRANSTKGFSCWALTDVLISESAKHGTVVDGKVHVKASQLTLAEKAATRQPTVSRTVKHLQAEGWLEFQPSEDKEKSGIYILTPPPQGRAKAHKIGQSKYSREGNGVTTESVYTPYALLRAPHLRWSGPAFYRENGEVVREYIRRLGKKSQAIIHRLEREGEMDISELAAAVKMRERDLRRNTEIRKGNLVQLEEAGIIEVEGDTARLTEDWETALEHERELKGEIDVAERQRNDHKRKREAFRNRNKVKPDRHWTNTGADGRVEDLRPASEPEPDNPAVPFVLDYVGRLGKIRFGLLAECWQECGDGDIGMLREAVKLSGVRLVRQPENGNALFLYPPLGDRGAA